MAAPEEAPCGFEALQEAPNPVFEAPKSKSKPFNNLSPNVKRKQEKARTLFLDTTDAQIPTPTAEAVWVKT